MLANRQIACADVVLLNKVDLVSEEELEILEAHIKRVNASAIIYRTVRGDIDLKHIMGIEAYAMRAMELIPSVWPARGDERGSPFSVSHIMILLSYDPDANFVPSCENATH